MHVSFSVVRTQLERYRKWSSQRSDLSVEGASQRRRRLLPTMLAVALLSGLTSMVVGITSAGATNVVRSG